MACPWQLYLFSLTNILAFIPILFFDYCKLLTGNNDIGCNPTERLVFNMLAICMLYVGLSFFILTYINEGDYPKLKRLSKFAGNASIATLTSVIMFGSTRNGGYERPLFHFGDMVWFFILYVLLVSSMASDDVTPAATRSNCRGGWGVNPKTLVFIIQIVIILKLFALTDFMPLSSNYFGFSTDEITDLARVGWNLTAVFVLEILLAFVFAYEYGNNKDQEMTLCVVIVMYVVSILTMIPMRHTIDASLIHKSFISMIVFIIVIIACIIGGRKGWGGGNTGGGYQSVPSVNV